MKPEIFKFALSLLLAGCSDKQEIYSSVNIPVISECRENLVLSRDKGVSEKNIKWNIIELSDNFPRSYFPNLEGVAVINSITSTFDEERILAHYVNKVFLQCYPSSSTEFEKSELGSNFNLWVDAYRKRNNLKAEYLVLKGAKVELYFKDAPTK